MRKSFFRNRLAVVGAGVVLAGFVWRAWYAVTDLGIYWPDEIFQTLEAAHRVTYGYGLICWEYVVGLRNWTLPGIFAGLMYAVRALGLDHPLVYLLFIRLLLVLFSMLGVLAAYKLVRDRGGQVITAWFAAGLTATSVPLIYFSYRTLSEGVAATAVLTGWWLATHEGPANKRGHWAGAGALLLALAGVVRLSAGLFAVVFLLRCVARRDWSVLKMASLVMAACWLLLLGWLDAVTWGSWFHSTVQYVQFNLLEGKSALWGVSPFTYYLGVMLATGGPIALLMLAAWPAGWRQARWFSFALLLYLLIHSAIPHKEFRFILPFILGLIPVAALGFEHWAATYSQQRRSNFVWLLAGTVAIFSLLGLPFLTRGSLGAVAPDWLAINTYGSTNRQLLRAHNQPDLCGLKLDFPDGVVWTGAYSFLHRRVPLYDPYTAPEAERRHYNYEIRLRVGSSPKDRLYPGGEYELVKLFDGPCEPDTTFTYRLTDPPFLDL